MPSRMHQMLVGLIARKMREKGYEIVAFDGKDYLFDGQTLPVPPSVGRHRPDILGVRLRTREICVGEAKTGEDLKSRRTANQLSDYARTTTVTADKPVEVIWGFHSRAYLIWLAY